MEEFQDGDGLAETQGEALDHASVSARLRSIEGVEVEEDSDLRRRSTLRIGGPADWLVTVNSEPALKELRRTLFGLPPLPFCVVGHGSNVLFPDAGLRGVVCRLGGALRQVGEPTTRPAAGREGRGEDSDEAYVIAGGGVTLATLARKLTRGGLLGLEALSGFPSTVGGAVIMNAGCYGTEIRDVLVSARIVKPDGTSETVAVEDLGAGYRSTRLQGQDVVVTSAEFRLARGDGEGSMARIEELNRRRWDSLPSGKPNAGSIFKNPEGDYAGRLIESVGLKGECRGGAQISEKHANVIVNLGEARANDVLELMATAFVRVRAEHGVELSPELVLTGELATRWRERTRSS